MAETTDRRTDRPGRRAGPPAGATPGPAFGTSRRTGVLSAGLLSVLSVAVLAASPLRASPAGASPMVAWHAGAATRGQESTVAFDPVRELWDDDRVARRRDVAAACRDDASTLAIVTCDEYRTEGLDAEIDAVRDRDFRSAPTTAAKEAINKDDDAWLADRLPLCRAGYPTKGGGTIVQILVASCETAVSRSRLDAVEGRTVPTAQLTATDDVDPDATQYATTASGTRIGAIDTQGDQTGGVVIAWVVIAGYEGFVVDPADFSYVDGSFVDPGVVYDHPAGHHVPAGKEYVFGIDYSRMAQDPDAAARRGRFEYRDGADVVGAWR